MKALTMLTNIRPTLLTINIETHIHINIIKYYLSTIKKILKWKYLIDFATFIPYNFIKC